ncbi:MAG TPA: 4'-phosphopantetheinyl transferase superfamily protein [Solirubrobacteraceae bacterium]
MRATESIVHVWRADLTKVEGGFEQLLHEDELVRAARIVPARKRVLWARSRGVLRALLGRYLERDPRELRFAFGPHGKPALLPDGQTPTAGLRFNLSHSGGLALVAVTAGREVGIDLEVADRRVDELAIAARVLGRAQAARLAELDPRTREREFMRAWVAHEAAIKCHGLGLATQPGDSRRTGLWTAELDVGPASYAAVAVEDGPCELHSWDWRA